MYCKKCIRCGNVSYRADDQREWNCPFCGLDISNMPSEEWKEKGKLKHGEFRFLHYKRTNE